MIGHPPDAGEGTGFPSAARAWWTVAVVFVAYIASFVDRTILTLLVEPIRADVGLSDFQIGLVGGLAFGLFYAVMGLPLGWLADRYDRRGIIAIGVFVWSIATAACGLAHSFGGLFAARMFVGVGEAALAPAALSLIAASFPPARRALPVAVFVAAGSVGGGLAMIFGGRIVGAITSGALAGWPLAGSLAPWQTSFVLVGLAGLPIALAAFTIVEPQRAVPASKDPRTAAERPHWPALVPLFAAMALLSVVAYGDIAWIPSHFIRDFGWQARDVGAAFGLVFLIGGGSGAVVGGVWASRSSDKSNVRIVGIGLSLLIPAATIAPLMPSAWWTLMALIPTMFLFSLPSGVAVASVQVLTPASMRGRTTALYYLSINLVGLSLGAPLVALAGQRLGGLGHGMTAVAAVAAPLAAWSAWRAFAAASERAA